MRLRMRRGWLEVAVTEQLEETHQAAIGSGVVFNVPASEPFLKALARAVLAGDLPRQGGLRPTPGELPNMTILLPTRRAVRGLQERFLDLTAGRAMLLPRIRAIAETNEDLSLISGWRGAEEPAIAGEVAPGVPELERHLVITSLVMRWGEAMRAAAESAEAGSPEQLNAGHGTQTAAQAIGLARELAGLMDMVETENVSLAEFEGLVPEDYSEHWQHTLKFLEIVSVMWPAYLTEKGYISQADRRNQLILAEARRLTMHQPKGPVIVAGVTGSIPATAELMRAVAGLANGAIVLPGLDVDLDVESWTAIGSTGRAIDRGGVGGSEIGHPEHPQFGLKKLIDAIGVGRDEVVLLPGCQGDEAAKARQAFVSEAMRPAMTTEKWHDYVQTADRVLLTRALEGVSLIEAGTAGEEAEAVSLILRHAVEVPGRTAALVTRDRLLARRVTVRLEAWGIRVDDSAGRPFAKTLPGTFLDLIAETVHKRFAPVPLMALLKHPFTRLGLAAGDVRRAARALELAVFRTIYLGRGLDGVRFALMYARDSEERHGARRRVSDPALDAAFDLVDRLEEAIAPFAGLFQDRGKHTISVLVEAHAIAAEAMARLALPASEAGQPEQRGAPVWEGESGETAQSLVAGLIETDVPSLLIAADDYPEFYRSIAAREVVRSRVPVHPRLSIWGPFEARLQQPDVVVLGGLNEGSWPEAADPGPWLNRPMRQALGVPQPEERIGYSCHDFTSLLGAKNVYLTRALKVDGAPAVPSRWLMRIKALVDGVELGGVLQPPLPWLGWAANRSVAGRREVIQAPRPKPPISARPRVMSVSDVERWVQNPYAIYASKILRLEPLAKLGEAPNAALRGSLVHAALSEFAVLHGRRLPDDPAAALLKIAGEILERWTHDNRIAAFWVPRFERFAEWFGASEALRREKTIQLLAEVSGSLEFEGPAGPFKLTARADRIDVQADGVVITDYKTMAEQGLKQLAGRVLKGYAPQLPLEALIAQGGGFAVLGERPVAGLAYISASGAEPPGAALSIEQGKLAQVCDEARQGLVRLIARFDDADTSYDALRRAGFNYDYDDYAELARVGEWSAGTGEGEDE